jgi:hypothetical protein
MKPIFKLAFFSAAGLLCGCGSIVVSTKETSLPKTSEPLTSMRYYLPKGRIQVTAKWDKIIPGWEPTCLMVAEADPDECYRLDRSVNAFFDDRVVIRVNPSNGLLEEVDATSSDQTINAVASLAGAVAAGFTFSAELGPTAKRGARGPGEFETIRTNAYKSSFQVLVDRDEPKHTVYLVAPETVLDERLYAKYDISLEPVLSEPSAPSDSSSGRTNFNGIVVRIAVPYRLTIDGTFYKVPVELGPEHKGESRGTEHDPGSPQYARLSRIVLLPDQDHNYFLPLARIPLVTASTTVKLANGMVQELELSRPSMVGAVAGVPKTIVSALVPIPIAINQSQTVSAPSTDKGSTGGHSTDKGSTDGHSTEKATTSSSHGP